MDGDPGQSLDKQTGISFDDAEFVSFSDDLQKLTDDGFSADGAVKACVGVEDGYKSDAGSFGVAAVLPEKLFSPSSFEQEPQHVSQFVPQSTVSASTDSHAAINVNFDVALNVALNSMPSEMPLQVWETGIWKHIFWGERQHPRFRSLGTCSLQASSFFLGCGQLHFGTYSCRRQEEETGSNLQLHGRCELQTRCLLGRPERS